MHSFSSFYHAIYIVFTYFASFTGFEDDFLKLFLICTFKDPNLAENLNLGGKSFKNLNSTEFMEFVFSKSDCQPAAESCRRVAGQVQKQGQRDPSRYTVYNVHQCYDVHSTKKSTNQTSTICTNTL